MASGGEVESSANYTSRGLSDYTCSSCSKDENSTRASHYCPDCDACYCKACLCDHDVIGRARMQSWGKPRSTYAVEKSSQMSEETTTVGLEKCLHHPEIDVEFYCTGHDVVCCNKCFFTDHRQCSVKVIDYFTDNTDLEKDKQLNRDTLAILTETLEYVKTDKKLRITSTEMSHKRYVNHLESFRSKMNTVFDNILDESYVKKKHILSKIETDSTICQTLRRNLSKFRDLQQDYENERSNFIHTKKCKELIQKYLQSLKEIRSEDIKDRVSFDLIYDQDIEETLASVIKLGDVKLGLARYSVRMDEDGKRCEICSMCQLTDGRTLLSDTANKCLKVLDESLTIVSCYEFTNTPRGMCVINDTDVAVGMDNQTVEIIHVTENVESLRTLKINRDCSHLAFANNMIYIAASNKCDNYSFCQCSITIYKFNVDTGEAEGSNSVDDKPNHNYTSTGSLHLKVNAEGSQIYISAPLSYRKVGLLVCDNEGEKIGSSSTYRSNEITGMHCEDSDVYICCSSAFYRFELKDVSQITSKEIARTKDGIPIPLSIAWNKNVGRVMLGGKDDYIYMV